MAWKKEEFGTLPDGRTAWRFTLSNENGVSASFTDLGGTWLTMMVPDRNGSQADVVLGYDTVEACMNYPGQLGAVVGRNANRIQGASFILNGNVYQLAANSLGKNNLHSGPDFFKNRLWGTGVEEASLGTRITFSLFSPDGDQGYPGNADITISYTLTPDNSLQIDYRMTADADTIANFTQHAYFNLAGHDSGSALEQQVWIDADAYTPADAEGIPTGEIIPVGKTPLDFTVMKKICRDIKALSNGYDHNLVMNHPDGEVSLCASAMDEASGRVLNVYTDLPGLQFYTANSLNCEYPAKNGALYRPFCGYCFETHFFPDAVNKPQFKSPILKNGREYRTTTVYQFGVADDE